MGESTVGRMHHAHKQVPAIVRDLDALPRLDAADRMKLVFLAEGRGVVSHRQRSEFLLGPAVLCADHLTPWTATVPGAQGVVFLFHPQYVNDALTFEAMATGALAGTDRQDLFLLARFLPERPLRERVVQLQPGLARAFTGLLERIQLELREQPDGYWPCRSRSYFLQLLVMLEHAAEEARAAPLEVGAAVPPPWLPGAEVDQQLRELLVHLSAHCHEAFTVEGLARALHTNRTTLQRRFRRATGMSVAQYVIRLRVQLASLLLRDTSLSVQEVMDRTGFSDPAHFSRTFKKHLGVPPSEFRTLFHVPGYILA